MVFACQEKQFPGGCPAGQPTRKQMISALWVHICTCLRLHMKETVLLSNITWSKMGN